MLSFLKNDDRFDRERKASYSGRTGSGKRSDHSHRLADHGYYEEIAGARSVAGAIPAFTPGLGVPLLMPVRNDWVAQRASRDPAVNVSDGEPRSVTGYRRPASGAIVRRARGRETESARSPACQAERNRSQYCLHIEIKRC